MNNEDFRNDTITITRDEFSSIIACETIQILKNARKRAENGDDTLDEGLIEQIQNLLMMFGADIMTALFDEGKVDNLEIEGK